MRTLGEILSLAVTFLKEKEVPSPRFAAEMLLAHVLQKQRIDLYMHFDFPLGENELSLFRAYLKRAAFFEPVEQIISQIEFYGCSLFVSKDVLLPRPETEILVDKACVVLAQEKPGLLLDLCTGSGCIGLSIKKKIPAMKVVLADISPEALSVARQNALRNGLVVEFLEGDFFVPFKGRKANFIFCNPPYVTKAEYEKLDASVREFEPKIALVSGDTGLEFYERLALELPEFLAPQGRVFLEIGTGQGPALNHFFSSSIWKKKELFLDFAGHDRFFFLEIE